MPSSSATGDEPGKVKWTSVQEVFADIDKRHRENADPVVEADHFRAFYDFATDDRLKRLLEEACNILQTLSNI